MASAICTVKNGGAAAVASGTGQNVTPGNVVTLALADSVGVTQWIIKAIWTNGSLNETALTAALNINQTTFTATFTAPVDGTGVIFWSEVLCLAPPLAFSTPQASFGVYCAGGGGSLLTFAPDNGTLISAMQGRKLRATT